jgi:sec-independent protein translocase protein TatA
MLAFLPTIGLPELVIIGGIVLLLFGTRLPGVMRSLGRGVVEFKKGLSGTDDDATTQIPNREESVPK